MPHKSKHVSNLFIAIGGVFSFLLILSSIIVSEKTSLRQVKLGSGPLDFSSQSGLVAGIADQKAADNVSPDSLNWKSYRDPVYHFEIKYPQGWAAPIAKKITDPDFDYDYQVSFGTPDTMAGNGLEGLNIFVFPSEKCASTSSGGQSAPTCASKKTQTSLVAPNSPEIIEFFGKAYSYTIIPLISENDSNKEVAKKTNLELQAAVKTFSFDSSLKLLNVKKTISPPDASKSATAAPQQIARPAKSGKISGGIPVAGGKYICPHPNRKPMRSPNKGNHVDEDCCPDPDEWPNSACIYKPSDYKIMLTP